MVSIIIKEWTTKIELVPTVQKRNAAVLLRKPGRLAPQYASRSARSQSRQSTTLNQVGDRIISYDFGETFCISDYEMRLLPRSVSHFLSLFQRRISLCDFNYPSLAKEFNIDPEYQKREILNVVRRVMQITEDDISQLETELNTIFQPVIAQYYVGCIRILQNRISKL